MGADTSGAAYRVQLAVSGPALQSRAFVATSAFKRWLALAGELQSLRIGNTGAVVQAFLFAIFFLDLASISTEASVTNTLELVLAGSIFLGMTEPIEAITRTHVGLTELSIVVWVTDTPGGPVDHVALPLVAVHVVAGLSLSGGNIFQAFVLLCAHCEAFGTQTFECQVVFVTWY